MSKKYFWLKLKDDFFTDKKIKKLRKLAGGDTHTIIYLKMQLLSLKNDGYLIFDELTNEFYEEIALELDEDEDNVKFTLMYLMNVGLVEEVDEKSLAMIETIDNIGKESESAKRVRALRERQKKENLALQCNVTHVTEKVTKVTCNTEKEKEKEIELEINNKTISEVPAETPQVEKVDLIHEQALRVFEFYVGITKSKIKPSAAHLKEVKGRLKDKVITEQECYEIINFKHAECVRSGNFKYFTLVSMFRASNVPNTLQAIELMKNGMGMEFKDRNNFNKGHQPYVSPSHQAPQQKELIQILEEELPF
jgi:predicted phage replisome organizer